MKRPLALSHALLYDPSATPADESSHRAGRRGRVVLGSDYNQDMSCERPVQFVESVPGLSEQERALILEGNAKRLLKL